VALLRTIDSIAGRIERIIDKLGLGRAPMPAPAPTPTPAAGGAVAPAPAAAGGQSQFLALLADTRVQINAMTQLLAVAGGTPAPASSGPSLLDAPDAERWRAWLVSLTPALEAATRLVGGLVVAVPTAISALAWILDRLPDLRDAIGDTLRFVVRNVLLLRGAVIVLALETLAMIARVAAMAVRTLAATVDAALAALFSSLAELLAGVLKLAEILGRAVVDTVNQLLGWLVPAVYKILWEIGELRLFRVLERLIDALPALLALMKTTPPTTPPTTPATPGGGSPAAAVAAPPPPPPPDLAAIMGKASAEAKEATEKLTAAAKKLVDEPADALRQGLLTFGERLDQEAIKESTLSETNLATRLGKLGEGATTAADALLPRPAPAGRQNVWDRISAQTPFHPIAEAYGQWLATGGLTQLLGSMQTYFATPSAVPDAAQRSPAAAVVQVDEVVIDVAPAPGVGPVPPAPSGWGPGDFPVPAPDDDLDRWAGCQRLDEIRGSRGRRRPYVPVFG
jgi:hypothetical protein